MHSGRWRGNSDSGSAGASGGVHRHAPHHAFPLVGRQQSPAGRSAFVAKVGLSLAWQNSGHNSLCAVTVIFTFEVMRGRTGSATLLAGRTEQWPLAGECGVINAEGGVCFAIVNDMRRAPGVGSAMCRGGRALMVSLRTRLFGVASVGARHD